MINNKQVDYNNNDMSTLRCINANENHILVGHTLEEAKRNIDDLIIKSAGYGYEEHHFLTVQLK